MDQHSSIAQMMGSSAEGQANTPHPTPGSDANPRIMSITQGTNVGESGFSPLMLQQMKAMIDGALEGALEKRLATIGTSTLADPNNPSSLPESKGNQEKAKGKHASRLPNPKVLKDVITKLPQIQEDGQFTDYGSSDDEVQETSTDQEKTLTDMLQKQIQDQQDQMRVMAKELEELRKAHQASETRNADESVHPAEDTTGTSVARTGKESRSECGPDYVNENSPFSADIQTDPIPKNFKSVSCEYKGQGDPEEHLMKFESLCLLHQYSEGVKCRVFLTTLSGPAQQWFQQLPRDSIHSFKDLREIFLHQFVSSKKSTKN